MPECWPAASALSIPDNDVTIEDDTSDGLGAARFMWTVSTALPLAIVTMSNRNSMVDTIKILLADDHAVVRQGTRELLEQQDDLEVVAEACDGKEAVHLALKKHPDVVIMDLAMPELNGIEATRQIKAVAPGIAILVLTAHDSDQYVFAFLEAGAAGYLLKDVSVDELVKAIRAVHGGESVLHPAITRKVINRFAHAESRHHTGDALDQLTERELEVLRMAARGLSNRDIARELSISIRTVQTHLSNVFNKMGVGSRTEAVMHGLKIGLLTLDDAF
jgi:NarL family two-component system response regulator LiaR